MTTTPTAPRVDLPAALLQSVRSQHVVMFLGAGASMDALDTHSRSPPSAKELRAQLGTRFFNNPMEDYDLTVLAEMAIQAHGQATVFEFVRSQLEAFQPSLAHKLLPTFRWRGLATTNYDLLVNKAYSARDRLQTLVPFVKDSEPVEERLQREAAPLMFLKLHGCLNHLHDKEVPLVLSPEHYSQYERHRTRLYDRLRSWAFESAFVFVGYKLADPHIRNLIYDLAADGIKRPAYYIVTPKATDFEMQFWASRNVHVIKTTFHEFMQALDREIPQAARALAPAPTSVTEPVRRHFNTNQPTPPALATALERDLTLVHPQMPLTAQDPQRFYQGFDTGWGAIAQRLDFPRRIVDNIVLDAVLDAPTGPELEFYVVTGPAGSGKTIALKRAAWEAAADYDALVLWLNDSGAISFDTLAELHRLSGKRLFLFVDKLALRVDALHSLIMTAKLKGLPLTLIGAERLNEWNVYCERLQQSGALNDMAIPNLNGSEIEALLDLLTRHNALGLLAGQPRDAQVRAFTDRAENQLLVALHETTLGKPLEKIVHEEYLGIVPEQARQLYLDICTLHQYGVAARAGTISRISGIRFADYQRTFLVPLENVVIDDVDRYTGDRHYTARHAHIAKLVFQQACATDEERAEQLARIVGALDIGYSSDSRALEEITRGRKLADDLTSPEAGRTIYRAALEAAPDRAFIFQQWSIFELNHPRGSLEESDRLVREALLLDPDAKPIKHTHALICRKRANLTASPLAKEQYRRLARERLSEMRADRDAYVLSARVNITIDEIADLAQALADPPNQVDLAFFQDKIKDAEKQLAQFQQLFPDDSEPHKAEARLRDILSQHKRAVAALEKAWKAGPRGSGVAIRLAQYYEEHNEPDRSGEVLRSAIERNPDDRMAHLEMAKYLLAKDPDRHLAIQQHLAKSYASNDHNYEARYLHAQYLFLTGSAYEAQQVFAQIDRHAPPHFRQRAPAHDTIITSRLGRYTGTIASLKATIGFIQSAAYPARIFTHANDTPPLMWSSLRASDTVSFKVRFNRKGPIAVDVLH